MKKLLFLSGKAFMFYWVDAIIVQGVDARNHIVEYLNGEGIEFKTIEISKMIRQVNKITTYSDYHIDTRKNNDGSIKNEYGERVFNFRKNDFITLTKRYGKKRKGKS